MAVYPQQVSFAAGEISPSLYGRDDLAKYAVGVKELTNFIVHPHGGASNRPGTRFVAPTKNNGKARLVPFEASASVSYVLEFGAGYVRFCKDGAQLTVNGSPYEVATPYAAGELEQLSFAQSADVLFICHPDYQPRELSRLGDTNWILSLFDFTNGPLRTQNSTDITMTPSAVSGSVAITASAAFFASGHVGSLLGIYHDVDEVVQKTSGDADGTWIASSFYGGSEEVESGDHTKTSYYFYVFTDTQKAQFTAGRLVRIGGTVYTVASVSADYRVTFSTAPGWSSGTISCDVYMPSSDSGWGVEVTCYGTWHFETRGFWSGTVVLQRYNEDEGAWVEVFSATSGASAAAAKNYLESGTVDEPTKMRIVSSDFAQFLPEGNTDADRGYCILTANNALYMGIAKITAVNSATSATATVLRKFAGTKATKVWCEGAWSNLRGWPSVCGFHDDRLCFGGTASDPQTVWMSVTGDYYNFDKHVEVQDDDCVVVSLVSRRVSPVRAFISLSNLIVLTALAEWVLGPGNSKSSITPSGVSAKAQGYRGCSLVPPVVVGDMILFVQKQGRILRDLGYVFESDSYNGNDLTILAKHLFRDSEIVSMDYQQEPDSIVWCVLADGTLLALTYLREHDVVAWSRIETDGLAESVCCVSTAARDQTWLVVKRTINGTEKRFVELMEERITSAPEDCFFVDCGITQSSTTAFTVVGGLEHLAGAKVDALADGSVVSGLTVATDGTVTLPHESKVCHAGLPYSAALETLDLNVQRNNGVGQGRPLRIVSCAVRFEDSRGAECGAVNKDGTAIMKEFKERSTENYGAPTRLFTGIREVAFESDYSQGRIRIEENNPLPCTVLALLPKAALGER